MEKDRLNHYKHQLEKEREELKDMVSGFDTGLDVSLKESVEELSSYDQHPADVASETFERSKDFALREDMLLKLEAIDHAMHRIKNGEYGICEACGKPIPTDRLDAVPYTTQCVDCRAKSEEAVPRINVRPVEEDVLEPPFAKNFNDNTDKNEFDAEDSWQAFARWQENAPEAGAGSYYGGVSGELEDNGSVEDVDNVPYEVGDDGMFYESTKGVDDESPPAEQIDVGLNNK